MENPENYDLEFDQYLNDIIHEKIENTIFETVRSAFQAGWSAAMKYRDEAQTAEQK